MYTYYVFSIHSSSEKLLLLFPISGNYEHSKGEHILTSISIILYNTFCAYTQVVQLDLEVDLSSTY